MVPRIRLNLSAPGINRLFLLQKGLLLLTLGALSLTGFFWWIGNDLHQQIDQLDEQVTSLSLANEHMVAQAKGEGLDLSNAAIAGIPKQVSFVKNLRERVGFSWTQLLTDLESALPPRISLNTVSMEEKTHTIQLQGAAKSLDDLNRLIHKLEDHTAFHHVLLSQHATKHSRDNHQESVVSFSMKVTYRP
jgi:Tfp pilus assembly protein PilN